MNEQEAAITAHQDQTTAFYRDHAEACKTIHDQYIRAGFSPDHAMELLHRQLNRVEGMWCDCDD